MIVTCLVGEGKAMGVIFLNFSNTFGSIPHSILLDKWSNYEMNRFYVRLGSQLAEQKSSEGCSECGCIWLVDSHPCCSSGINSSASSKTYLSTTWMQELNASLENSLMILNWEMPLTLWRGSAPGTV